MSSNFKKVSILNTAYGRPVGDPANPDWGAVINQFDLVLSEVKETQDAVGVKDISEVIDGLADILVTTYGMGHVLGIDLDKVMAEVDRANMSKVCRSMSEVTDTIFHYTERGIDNDNLVYQQVGQDMFVVKTEKACTDNHGTEYSANKVLKNVNWSTPDHSDFATKYRLEQ